MSLEDRQADAYGKFELMRDQKLLTKEEIRRVERLNDKFASDYEKDDEDDGDRAYDSVERLESYVNELWDDHKHEVKDEDN